MRWGLGGDPSLQAFFFFGGVTPPLLVCVWGFSVLSLSPPSDPPGLRGWKWEDPGLETALLPTRDEPWGVGGLFWGGTTGTGREFPLHGVAGRRGGDSELWGGGDAGLEGG